MFVRVHTPLKTTGGSNKGSSATLLGYLSKEDKDKTIIERTGFFTQSEKLLTESRATAIIDGNNKNLGTSDYKFYMVSISPRREGTTPPFRRQNRQ